jgi:hypothetical protein
MVSVGKVGDIVSVNKTEGEQLAMCDFCGAEIVKFYIAFDSTDACKCCKKCYKSKVCPKHGEVLYHDWCVECDKYIVKPGEEFKFDCGHTGHKKSGGEVVSYRAGGIKRSRYCDDCIGYETCPGCNELTGGSLCPLCRHDDYDDYSD